MISARPLYGEWVNFKPVGKILLTINNRPETLGSDDGIWRAYSGDAIQQAIHRGRAGQGVDDNIDPRTARHLELGD